MFSSIIKCKFKKKNKNRKFLIIKMTEKVEKQENRGFYERIGRSLHHGETFPALKNYLTILVVFVFPLSKVSTLITMPM